MNKLRQIASNEKGTRRGDSLKVLLTTEGTYPFHSGGVSTWCQDLIESLPNISFEILSVESTPWVKSRFQLPANVNQVRILPQWHSSAYDAERLGFYRYASRWLRTIPACTNKKLFDDLEAFFSQLFKSCPHPAYFAKILLNLNRFWRRYDYHRTFRSTAVWHIYQETVNNTNWPETPNKNELGYGLYLMQNLFAPLAVKPPRADIAHSSAAAFCSLPAVVAKAEWGTPMILSEHGVYLRERLLELKRLHHSSFIRHLYHRLIKSLVRLSYHTADRILPVCNFNSRWEEHMGADVNRITTVYNGVDPQRFAPVFAGGSGAPRRPTAVSLARIHPLKDIETLLNAADLVRREIPDVKFKLYGDIWDEEYFQQCLRLHESLGLGSSFEFAGHTDSPATAYQQGDIVVLSSISEAFPYAAVEAMMCGRPVVATAVGGVTEALSGCGLMVDPRQPQALATACIKLLRNKRRRELMGKRALFKARAEFTIKEMAATYAGIYHETASGSQRQDRIKNSDAILSRLAV